MEDYWKQAQKRVKEMHEIRQQNMQKYFRKHYNPHPEKLLPPLVPGDMVLTKKHHLQRTKIDYPYSGPYEVVRRIHGSKLCVRKP